MSFMFSAGRQCQQSAFPTNVHLLWGGRQLWLREHDVAGSCTNICVRLESAGVYHEVTQDVRALVFHSTSVTFSLSCCSRHLSSDQVRQVIRRDCRPARILFSLQFSSLSVFDQFTCPDARSRQLELNVSAADVELAFSGLIAKSSAARTTSETVCTRPGVPQAFHAFVAVRLLTRESNIFTFASREVCLAIGM